MFNALQEIKQEAYVSAENNRLRWSDPSEMDKITPEGYKKKSNETQKDADTIFDFGMCLDDVLLHAYNNSIAEHLDKPKKKLEMIERRRYLTEDGFVDKRKVRGKNK